MGKVNRASYAKLTDLGVSGTELRLEPDLPLIWVQKLNSFEMEEARHQASVVRSRVVMALRESTGAEMAAMRDLTARLTRDRMIEGLVSSKYTKHVGEASAAVYADPEWHERLDVRDRSDRDLVPAEERAVIDKINSDYLADITNRIKELEVAERERLREVEEPELREEYIETFIDTRASAVYMREMKFQQIIFGVRMCDAIEHDAPFDHSACTHAPLYADYVEEPDGEVITAHDQVQALSDELLVAYQQAFDRVNVPARAAKDSASRQASSEPSRPQSVEEPSPVSTPEAAPGQPVGTSA